VAHLATCDTSLKPHVIPICFVLHDDVLYSSIDEKPKRIRAPTALRRVVNIKANPNVCVVIDQYEEDWRKLRFIIIHGKAKLVRTGEEHRLGIIELRRKYPQYRSMNLDSRPIIKIVPRRTVSWRSDKKTESAERSSKA